MMNFLLALSFFLLSSHIVNPLPVDRDNASETTVSPLIHSTIDTGIFQSAIPPGYCSCPSQSSIWLDLVVLIDTSDAMGNEGMQTVTAAIETALGQLTLERTPSGRFYTRVAVVAYGLQTKVVRNFDSTDDIFDMDLPNFAGQTVNITRAIDVALDIFKSNSNAARNNTRRVILIAAGAYNDGIYDAAKQFKDEGGVIMILEYVQRASNALPGLKNLGSPGYYFTNTEDFHHRDLGQAFCDANCFCVHNQIGFSVNNDQRNVPNGGCYNPINLPAAQRAAEAACRRQNAILAAVHDDEKQMFLRNRFSPSTTKYWIGLRKDGGVWNWDDNSTSTYNNFHYHGTAESGDCAYSVAISTYSSEWHWDSCRGPSSYDYVCQSRPCDSTYYCF